MSLEYEYACPDCSTTYIGDLEDGESTKSEKIVCEECHYEMDIQVEIHIIVFIA